MLTGVPRAAADVDHDGQIWTAVLSSGNPGADSSKLRVWFDAHLRRSSGGIVHIARPAVGWSFSPSLSVWAGYAWVPVIPDEAATVHEHRAWQQIIFKRNVGSLSLQSRTRFESRFSGAGDDVGFRVREFVRASWQKHPSSRRGFVVWDEVFIGLNEPDWGARKGFDQNRLFVGPFFKVGKRMRLEMGYLFLFAERGDTDTVGHVFATNLFLSL